MRIMSRNAGVLLKMADGRFCIMYHKQPLIKERGKVILHLVDSKCNKLLDANKKPKILIKSVDVYNEEAQAWRLIGYID